MAEITQDKDNATNYNSSDVKRTMIGFLILLLVVGGLFLVMKRFQVVSSKATLAVYVSDAKDAESAPASPERAALINATNKAAADGVLTKQESAIVLGRLEEFRALEKTDTK